MSGWGGGFNRSSNVAASERSALLVRAQVGEPRKLRGYVRGRSPFVFLYREPLSPESPVSAASIARRRDRSFLRRPAESRRTVKVNVG